MKIEESKYFIPDLSELYAGYKWEFDYGAGFIEETIKEGDFKELTQEDINKKGRTKYIDAEDFEKLGWKFVKVIDTDWRENGALIFKIDWSDCPPPAMCSDHFHGTFVLKVNRRHTRTKEIIPEISIVKETRGGFSGQGKPSEQVFKGKCKSINDLKVIHRLLNIQ